MLTLEKPTLAPYAHVTCFVNAFPYTMYRMSSMQVSDTPCMSFKYGFSMDLKEDTTTAVIDLLYVAYLACPSWRRSTFCFALSDYNF
jgi:hypothetical protein